MSLDAADLGWLRAGPVQKVFDLLEQDGDEARVVGGAVRNACLGLAVDDIDIATTAPPEVVMARAQSAGIKAVGTGMDHGTVTLVLSGQPFEVTTLREDVETFGRKAVVKFGRDWLRDAQRRDFTLNALYLDRDGKLLDPLGGLADCKSRRIVFIGDAEQRIREDYLRILRYFRFNAHYGDRPPQGIGREACAALKDGLQNLSAERISKEFLKLLTGQLAGECLSVMEADGILAEILPAWSLADFNRYLVFKGEAALPTDAELALLVLAVFTADDAKWLPELLRLSGAVRKRFQAAIGCASMWREIGAALSDQELRHGLYAFGREAVEDALILVAVRGDDFLIRSGGPLGALLTKLSFLDVPVFPISGADLLAVGVPAGPKVGKLLKSLEASWVKAGFSLTREDLLQRLP